VAATVENPTWIDDHAGRMDLAGYHTLSFNFDAALGEDHAVEAAGDYYAIAFDLAFDFGVLAEDDSLLGDDVALHVPVNAERAADRERSFQGYALIDESCPLFAAAAACGTGPLPCHENYPQECLYKFSCRRLEVNASVRVECRMAILNERAGEIIRDCRALRHARNRYGWLR
jgi:hypothetical protein